MSLDYPNRETWLKVRATPRKRSGRVLHVSAPVITFRDPETEMLVFGIRRPGKTYRDLERNAIRKAHKEVRGRLIVQLRARRALGVK